ncbi:hypothetical protein F53441_9595 [Fusarium austroafricanum]|uniref:Uncharacterized protein n=1 Tax=Fusarium austroafricanum TaxID=2364996 RepID=A0A8H4KD59_9HYPO|nr:hypothetical protein F53441_9595 [Fusarium austroafricanum]
MKSTRIPSLAFPFFKPIETTAPFTVFLENNDYQPSRGGGFGRGRARASRGNRQISNAIVQFLASPFGAVAAATTTGGRSGGKENSRNLHNDCLQPGSREEADAQIAKYEEAFNKAVERLAEWIEKRNARPEVPVAESAIEELLQKSLEERAAKRQKLEKEEEKKE